MKALLPAILAAASFSATAAESPGDFCVCSANRRTRRQRVAPGRDPQVVYETRHFQTCAICASSTVPAK